MYRRARSLCAVSFALLSLTGCGASGPKYSDPPALEADKARVFLYRMPGLTAGCCAVEFLIDGSKVAALRTGGYTWLTVSPGRHRVGMGDVELVGRFELRPLVFADDFEAGQTYCYRFAQTVGHYYDSSANTVLTNTDDATGGGDSTAVLSRIPLSNCTTELKDYRFAEPLIPHIQRQP